MHAKRSRTAWSSRSLASAAPEIAHPMLDKPMATIDAKTNFVMGRFQ